MCSGAAPRYRIFGYKGGIPDDLPQMPKHERVGSGGCGTEETGVPYGTAVYFPADAPRGGVDSAFLPSQRTQDANKNIRRMPELRQPLAGLTYRGAGKGTCVRDRIRLMLQVMTTPKRGGMRSGL